MVVEFFEVVVGGFRSFHVLVTTIECVCFSAIERSNQIYLLCAKVVTNKDFN